MGTERLKLLHITEGFDGGVVTFLRHVLPGQCARGVDVALACSPRQAEQQEDDLRFLEAAGVKVHRVPMGRSLRPWRDVAALIGLTRLLRQHGFDLVHTHCFKAGVLGRLAVRIAFPAAKVVHTPHCFPFLRCRGRSVGAFCGWVERSLAGRTDCLMMVSRSQQQAAVSARIGIATPCVVVPNAPPPACKATLPRAVALRRELALAPQARLAGTCARLVDYKCVDHLLAAAALVRERLPECVFLIVGDGPQRGRLSKSIRRLQLGDTVRLLGHRNDTRAVLSLLDVFVLCSKAEGMPYVLLEAAQAGVARIASAVPGNVDVIEDGRSGLLYPWGRIDRLAETIVRCLADDALRRRLSQAARQESYSLDDQVDAMVRLYQALCSGAEMLSPCLQLSAAGVPVGEECS